MRTPDELLAAARQITGVDDPGSGPWRDALDVLWTSIHAEAGLNEGGERIFESWVGTRLANRLRLEDWADKHPGALKKPVERPIVILGMLRTGTTILSELLACDTNNRPLMKWEALDAIPPPRIEDRDTDPRIAREVGRVERMFDHVPHLRAVHYERGDGPTECVALLGQSFRSQDWAGLFHVPTYTRWLHRCAMDDAYAYHRKALQVLQTGWNGRWCLKAPGHMFALDALLATYPDARLVVTHRDPLRTVASSASLSVQSRPESLTTADLDGYFGAMWLEVLQSMVDQLMEFRQRRPDVPFLDLHFEDFVANPISAVEKIYDFDGRPFDDAARSTMETYLAEHPKGEHGSHRYELSDFGLSKEAVTERFATYCRHFDVPHGTRTS